MKDDLTRTSTLVVLFVIFVAGVACFIAVTPVAGGLLLDNLGPAAASKQLRGAMSERLKTAHFRITLWRHALPARLRGVLRRTHAEKF